MAFSNGAFNNGEEGFEGSWHSEYLLRLFVMEIVEISAIQTMWMEVEAQMEVQYKRRQKIMQKMLQTDLQTML
ncbi:hypothetical protein Hanom_Chr08g00693791 [Helianthus anomalus]